jgi:hypothetical protein
MVFVFVVTIVSLIFQVKQLMRAAVGTAPWINGLVSVVLLALALVLVGFAARAWIARAPV